MDITPARLAAVLFAAPFFAACAPHYYAPNAQNVPLLASQGSSASSVSFSPDLHRADLRVALAVTKHVAVQGNGALWLPPGGDTTDAGSGALMEMGVGYTTALPLPQPDFFLEVYALTAYGAVENHFPASDDGSPNQAGKIEADVARFSLQPAVGYKHRYFEAAVSARYAVLLYFLADGDLVSNGKSQDIFFKDHPVQIQLEPAITLRAGLPTLMAEAQAGHSFNLSAGRFPQDANWMSLGLVYRFQAL